ncbi:uncharacterized protein LOC118144502 [Callithrix jacchus]
MESRNEASNTQSVILEKDDIRVLRECKEPETAPAAGKAAEPSKGGSSSSATAAAAFSSSPGSSAAADSPRAGGSLGDCSGPSTATLYVPSTTTPIHTPSLPPPPPPPPPRPLRSPSLDWSRDKSNGKRRAGTLPADPGRDRTGPGTFPSLAGAPNPPPPPRAPLPDFRKFTKNSPHEFSCPADPRWRRIHRGGCWEQDLYPLTAAVTPVAPASLQAAAEGGSGDAKLTALGWVGRFQHACNKGTLSVFVFVFVLDTPPPHVRRLTPPLFTPATWSECDRVPVSQLGSCNLLSSVRVLQGPSARHRHLLSSQKQEIARNTSIL